MWSPLFLESWQRGDDRLRLSIVRASGGAVCSGEPRPLGFFRRGVPSGAAVGLEVEADDVERLQE